MPVWVQLGHTMLSWTLMAVVVAMAAAQQEEGEMLEGSESQNYGYGYGTKVSKILCYLIGFSCVAQLTALASEVPS